MKQRYIAFLLILTTFLSSISFVIHADQPTYAYDVIQMANYIRTHYLYDEEGARSYVESVVGNRNYRTYEDRVVNIAILRDFNKLVYTHPKYDYYGYKGQDDYQKDENGKWHYRVLGYLYNDETEVTNPHFPNILGTTPFFSTYMNKKWFEPDGAKKTWKVVDEALAKHMLSVRKIYAQDGGGYVPGNINVKDDVLGGKTVDEAKHYAIYQTPSTLKMTGSIRLWHRIQSNGNEYYRTLDIAPVSFSLPQLKVSVEKPLYEFGKEEMTKNVKVTAEVYFDDFPKLDGWKMRDYIDHALIEVNGREQEVHFVDGKLKADFAFEEKRTNFKSGEVDTVTYNGRAKVVAQELFKDEFTCLGEASTNILVNAGEVEPYFVIKNNGVDVTDGVIEYKDWQDVNLTLEPNNRVSKPNEITNVLWTMESFPESSGLSEFKYGDQNVTYTMTEPKLSTHADSNGTATFTMKIFTLYKFDYGGLKGITEYTVPHTVTFKEVKEPDPTLKDPVARLGAPSKVRMGDRFTLSGTGSYDPDGQIVDYDFKLQAIREIEWLNDEKSRVKATVMSTSDNDIKLVVTDDDGLEDSTSDDIEILPPIEARMRVDGLRKVNRKITLNASESIDAYYFPIDDYAWTITPLEGQSVNSIKYETNNKGEMVNVLFKEEGAYQVKLNIHAQCTLPGDENYEASDSLSFPIMIQPDLKPTAGLTVISLALRDKMDDLNASIEMLDTSYSEDGDQTRVKQWYARHDSDNDGDRTDETWTPIGTAKVHELYKTKKLGDYDFYHEVVEVIPEEDTISKFLTESDYLTDNSLDQVYEERYCHVDNVAPVISTTAELEKEIDLLVITDEDGENYTKLLAEVNKLTKEMYERKFGVNHEIVNLNDETLPRKTVGLKKKQTFNWHRNWYINFQWAFERAFDYGDTNRIIRPYFQYMKGGNIETKQGTIDDMFSFQTYPDAYGEFKSTPYIDYYETGAGRDTWQITNLDVNIYDAPYDFNGTYIYPHNGYDGKKAMFLAGLNSHRDFYYRSNVSNIDKVTEWDQISGRSDFPNVFYPNMDIIVDKTWRQGKIIAEEDIAYTVPQMDSLLDSYANSKNDKYLILGIKDGRNLYLTEELRTKITEEYGFKVYISIDEFWGEFSPKMPVVKDVTFDEDGLYAQTKYGNSLKNMNLSDVDKVYYDYLSKDEVNVRYQNTFDDFKIVEPKTVGTETIYKTDTISNRILLGRYKINGEYVGLRDDKYRHHISYTPNSVEYKTETFEIGDTWVLHDGNSLNVKKVYSISNYSKIVETDDEKIYFVGNEFTSRGTYLQNLKAEELNIKGISSVKALNYNTLIYDGSGLTRNRDTGYLIEDLTGNYVFCTIRPYYSSRYPDFQKLNVIYFDNLENFSYSISDSKIIDIFQGDGLSTKSKVDVDYNPNLNINYYKPSGSLPNIEYERYVYTHYIYKDGRRRGTRYAYYWTNKNDNPREETYNSFSWIIADENGDVYVNGVKKATGGYKTGIGAFENDMNYAYVDENGVVYGMGTNSKGQLGHSNRQSQFKPVINSPYILNSTENVKNFDSVYDISSSSPAYMMVGRGAYSDITAKLLEEYADYEEKETIFIQVGDTIDIGGFVLDYEGDSIYEKRIDVTHDNTYFDNADTAWIPPADFDEPVRVDVPGRMEIRLRAQDNPVGSDERFAEYRYWNKDNTSIEVIAHRPPIAKLGYALVPQGDGSFNFSGTDNGSYDADHSTSRIDKGIIDRQFYYRKELDPTWTEFNGTLPIENGVKYQFALKVKDLEGAWSDYDIVDIKINGEPFVLSASIDPPYPESVPAGANITIHANVFTYKAMDSVRAYIKDGNDLIAEVDLSQDSVNGMERKYSKTYTLSNDLPDKDHYKVTVVATPEDGSAPKEVPLKLKVDTPISVKGTVNPDSITIGQVGTLTAQTTIYADECQVNLYDGTGKAVLVTLLKDGVPSGGMQNWKATHVFNEDMEEGTYAAKFHAKTENGNEAEDSVSFYFIPNQAPTISYKPIDQEKLYEGDDVTVIFEYDDPDGDNLQLNVYKSMDQGATWTLIQEKVSCSVPGSYEQVFQDLPSGDVLFRAEVFDPLSEKGETQGSIRVNPVELFNFRVTLITDHAFKDMSMPIYVGNMAVDESNHKDNKLMKLGYAFNFEIDSKGLFNDDDTVLIMPKFTTEAGEPLDMYYEDEINDMILGVSGSGGTRDPNDRFKLYYTGDMKPGEELGSFSVLMLPVGLRSIQENYETWKGRYGLPTSAVLVREGTEPRDANNHYKGKVVVEFVPQAVKKGSVRFNYVHSGMWEKERFENGGKINIVKYDKYSQGECILIDASTSSQDDYDSDRFLR